MTPMARSHLKRTPSLSAQASRGAARVTALAAARGAARVLLLATACTFAFAAAASAQAVTEIKVERVKPQKDKHLTLRFLKENRDFIRGRFDLLKENPVKASGDAMAIDPRFLAYQKLMAEALATRDSVATQQDAWNRRDLMQSVTQLGGLEMQLDALDKKLADQRTRLGVLQADFTGHQQTALIVVLRGYPVDEVPAEVALHVEDGAQITVALSAEQRQSLQQGGVVQIFHGFVEPRSQVIEIGLAADGGTPDHGYVALEPTRDRLTFLQLDMSSVHRAQGATGMEASTWLHDAEMPTGDR
jgi:hypothetical protein